jgi:hypothetical protein
VFQEKIGGTVFESNLLGTHIDFYGTYLKKHTIVHQIDIPMTEDDENLVYGKIVGQNDGKPYDYPAFFYFCWRAFLRKAFNRPMPLTNPWKQTDTFLCVELADLLPNVKKMDLAITSPHNLWKAYSGE